MLSKVASSTIFETLVGLDLGLNPGLPGHWRKATHTILLHHQSYACEFMPAMQRSQWVTFLNLCASGNDLFFLYGNQNAKNAIPLRMQFGFRTPTIPARFSSIVLFFFFFFFLRNIFFFRFFFIFPLKIPLLNDPSIFFLSLFIPNVK